MKTWVLLLLGFLPFTLSAQLPLPVLPDWLKPGGQKNFGVLTDTHVNLTENNYKIVQTNVIAKSKGFKLLGFITLKSASYTKAMSGLYSSAGVAAGQPQALANVIHESSSANFLLFSIPKVTIRADLIQFYDRERSETPHLTTDHTRVRERQENENSRETEPPRME